MNGKGKKNGSPLTRLFNTLRGKKPAINKNTEESLLFTETTTTKNENYYPQEIVRKQVNTIPSFQKEPLPPPSPGGKEALLQKYQWPPVKHTEMNEVSGSNTPTLQTASTQNVPKELPHVPSTPSPPPSPSKVSEQASKSAHVEVPQQFYGKYQEIKIRKKHRYIIFKINNWKLDIEKIGESRTLTLDNLLNDLPFSECRYVIFDHERTSKLEQQRKLTARVYFITWTPVAATTQSKMQYSMERDILIRIFLGASELTATTKDEILYGLDVKTREDIPDYEDEEKVDENWMDD